jgi:hypothetical protein
MAHEVHPQDVQQVLANPYVVTNNPGGSEGSVLLIGHTNGGRELTIVLVPTSDSAIWRPVTAWPSSKGQKAIFRRQHPDPRS